VKGNVVKTGAKWVVLVTAAYPGYSGFRPKMQVFHGTADTTLYPQNHQAVDDRAGDQRDGEQHDEQYAGERVDAVSVWDYFETYSAQGVTHNIPTQESKVMVWFDLTCTSGNCYSRSNSGSSGDSATTALTTVVTTAAGSTATAGSVVQPAQHFMGSDELNLISRAKRCADVL
jgi:hypothetical protein